MQNSVFHTGKFDVAPALPSLTLQFNLWHGTPVKPIELETEEGLKRAHLRKRFLLEPIYNSWDKFFVSNRRNVELFKKSMGFDDAQIVLAQQPRNTKINNCTEVVKPINVITYLPTFRSSEDKTHIKALLEAWPEICSAIQSSYALSFTCWTC